MDYGVKAGVKKDGRMIEHGDPESYLHGDEVMISKAQWESLGKPKTVITYRHPITDITNMTVSSKVLIGENYGVDNLGKGNVILPNFDVFAIKYGDFDGDGVSIMPVGKKGVPQEVADIINKSKNDLGGTMLVDVPEAAPKEWKKLGNRGTKLDESDSEFIEALSIMDTAIDGGTGVAKVASVSRIMDFLAANPGTLPYNIKVKRTPETRALNIRISNLATDAISKPEALEAFLKEHNNATLDSIIMNNNFDLKGLDKNRLKEFSNFLKTLQIPFNLAKGTVTHGRVLDNSGRPIATATENIINKMNMYNEKTANQTNKTPVQEIVKLTSEMEQFDNIFYPIKKGGSSLEREKLARVKQETADKAASKAVLEAYRPELTNKTQETKDFIDFFKMTKKNNEDDVNAAKDMIINYWNEKKDSYSPENKRAIIAWLAADRVSNLSNKARFIGKKNQPPALVVRVHEIITEIPKISRVYNEAFEANVKPSSDLVLEKPAKKLAEVVDGRIVAEPIKAPEPAVTVPKPVEFEAKENNFMKFSNLENQLKLTPGSTVQYNGKEWTYRGTNPSGFAQLTGMDGIKFPGTPRPDKLTVLKEAPVEAPKAETVIKAIQERPGATKTEGFTPNAEQQVAVNNINNFIKDKTPGSPTAHSLVGAAGTGKTSTLKLVIDGINKSQGRHESLQIAAPTHKAAQQVKKLTGKEASTIHTLLGLKPTIDLDNTDSKSIIKFAIDPYNKKSKMEYGGTLIVDESSMINDDLYDALVVLARRNNKKVLFVGDNLQLKPVNNVNSMESKAFRNPSNTSELKTVMRQVGDNPILETLDKVRAKIDSNEEALTDKTNKVAPNGDSITFTTSGKEFVDKIKSEFSSPEYAKDKDSVKVLAFTNNRVQQYNKAIREVLGYSGTPKEGELMMGYSNVQAPSGDALLVQNASMYNVQKIGDQTSRNILGNNVKGNLITIKDIYNPEGKPSTIFLMDSAENSQETKDNIANGLEALVRDISSSGPAAGKRWASEFYPIIESFSTLEDLIPTGSKKAIKSKTLDYGYAHTVHKSQGSTYKKVFVDDLDISNAPGSQSDRNRLKYVALSRPTNNAYVLTQTINE